MGYGLGKFWGMLCSWCITGVRGMFMPDLESNEIPLDQLTHDDNDRRVSQEVLDIYRLLITAEETRDVSPQRNRRN